MTQSEIELAVARFRKIWWWLDPSRKVLMKRRDEPAARYWEILRRTKTYQAMWSSRNAFKVSPSNSETPLMPLARLSRFNEEFGKEWAGIIFANCDSNSSWLDLSPNQKRNFRLNQPKVSRQLPAESYSPMAVFLCELERRGNKEVVVNTQWEGHGIATIKPTTPNVLPKNIASRKYLVVQFDHRLGRNTLEKQFKQSLDEYLQFQTIKSALEKAARKNWDSEKSRNPASVKPIEKVTVEQISNEINYPPLWADSSDWGLHPNNQVVLMPSVDQPYYLCWIPAEDSFDAILKRFNTQVRQSKLNEITSRARTLWLEQRSTSGNLVYPMYEPLPRELKVKTAVNHELWDGLSAWDFRPRKKSPITKIMFDSSPLKHRDQDSLLKKWRNAGDAISRRLDAIDDLLFAPVKSFFRSSAP